MFVRVVQGRVSDPDGLLSAWRQIVPRVNGWLGTTSGVTGDGRAILVARYVSAEAGDESAQPEWLRYLTDVTVADSADAFTLLDGGRDDASFVQVIQGRVSDVERLRGAMTRAAPDMRAARPDVIGALVVLAGDGRFMQVVYFSSEAAARTGEVAENAREPSEAQREVGALLSELTFLELREPLLQSPA
jgi:hypothetical protein